MTGKEDSVTVTVIVDGGCLAHAWYISKVTRNLFSDDLHDKEVSASAEVTVVVASGGVTTDVVSFDLRSSAGTREP